MNISDLVLATERLPDTVEQLLPLRFIGEKAVRFYKDKVDLIDKLKLGKDQRDETLRDGQDAGKALLMIEGKIGELYSKIPKVAGGDMRPESRNSRPENSKGKMETIEDQGIDRGDAWRAQRIHEHPEVVEEVIREAEEDQDIPTKGAVLTRISSRLQAEMGKEKMKKARIQLKGEALIYYGRLQDCINILPTHPPRELIEEDYKVLKALALIIIRRLEVFQDGTSKENTTGERTRQITGE